MDVLALFLALAAIVCFLIGCSVRARSQAPLWVPIGLALLTGSWICQCLQLTTRIPTH